MAQAFQATGAAGTATVKHQCIKVFATQCTYLLLTYYPAYTIYNIALATPIWAYNTSNPVIKIDNGLICKTFKSFNF